MAASPVAGAWRLVSFEMRDQEGQVSYPLGPNPRGYALYTGNGYVSISFMSADRPPFAAGDIRGGTVEEKARAADTYVAYSGTYELHGDSIVHHVEVSFFPNWVGVDQVRSVQLDGDRLSLGTPPILVSGRQLTGYLVWQRT